MGSSRRALAGSLALALAATLVALLLAEGLLRLRAAVASEPPPPAPLPAELRGLPELHKLKDLIRPNNRGVFQGALYRTNSRGVRGPDYSPEPRPGVFRVVVIGDSYTMGQGVSEQEAYPAVAGRMLSRQDPPGPTEAINLGVGGLALRHSIKRLRKIGMDYHPHLVVYGFTPNDILGPHYVEPPEELKALTMARIRRFQDSPSVLLRILWPRIWWARSAFSPLPGTYEHTLEENYFRNPAAAKQITDGLSDLARITQNAGICGFVFVHTRLNQLWFHPFTRIYDHVAALARERGLAAYVSFPHFRGRDVNDVRLSVIDTHPNALGHRIHAEALVEGLLQELPPHCWRPGHYVPASPGIAPGG